MLDAFRIHVKSGGLCAFANVGLLLCFGIFDAVDLIDSNEAEVVVFSEFVDLLLVLQCEPMVENDPPFLCYEAIRLPLIEIEAVVISCPNPLILRQFVLLVLIIAHISFDMNIGTGTNLNPSSLKSNA